MVPAPPDLPPAHRASPGGRFRGPDGCSSGVGVFADAVSAAAAVGPAVAVGPAGAVAEQNCATHVSEDKATRPGTTIPHSVIIGLEFDGTSHSGDSRTFYDNEGCTGPAAHVDYQVADLGPIGWSDVDLDVVRTDDPVAGVLVEPQCVDVVVGGDEPDPGGAEPSRLLGTASSSARPTPDPARSASRVTTSHPDIHRCRKRFLGAHVKLSE